jgi:hypothetical protein
MAELSFSNQEKRSSHTMFSGIFCRDECSLGFSVGGKSLSNMDKYAKLDKYVDIINQKGG